MAAPSTQHRNGADNTPSYNDVAHDVMTLWKAVRHIWPAIVTLIAGLYFGGWINAPAKKSDMEAMQKQVSGHEAILNRLDDRSLKTGEAIARIEGILSANASAPAQANPPSLLIHRPKRPSGPKPGSGFSLFGR